MTTRPDIKLLTFPGCPNAAETRNLLTAALEGTNLPATKFTEINIHDPSCPEQFRNYPSPTILVQGEDIEGMLPQNAAACRIYDGKGGVPEIEKIRSAITKHL